MLDSLRSRALVAPIVDPVARGLLALRLGPGAITVVGSAGAVIAALTTIPYGHWLRGVVLVAVFAVSDLLDGTMARLSGSDTRWGAFLDSTLDRITDAALSIAIVLALASTSNDVALWAAVVSLVAGQVVPYAKARAQSLGIACDVGLAERAERFVLMLGSALLFGLGYEIAATALLVVLALASVITVGQRVLHVRRALVHG